ncbi:MAG: hypothetical protein H7210_09430 [Pyrinomonadaceae bacterium]|nr:hypothetical protein [Phycisphaerales bacterium]
MLDRLIEFQLDHNAWATGRLIDACATLTPEQFERHMEIGPGSLQGTLSHIIETMFFFADCFTARHYENRSDFALKSRSVAGLQELLDRSSSELDTAINQALAGGVPAELAWASSEHGRMSGPAAVAQVFDHGSYHRAQCMNMLKRLGVLPLPGVDPMSFEEALR